jgi:hypothetical protein
MFFRKSDMWENVWGRHILFAVQTLTGMQR